MTTQIESQHDVSIATAKIGFVDLAMLIVMWLLVLATSIKSFGFGPAIAYILLNVILVMRSTINGLLVILLVFFSPAVSLGLPVGPFVLATGIIAFRYFIENFFLGSRGMNFVNNITLAVLIFFLYITLSFIMSPNHDLALGYYRKYFEGLVVVVITFASVNSRRDLGKIFKWCAIVAGLGLINKLAHVYLGTDTALFNMLETADLGTEAPLKDRVTIKIGGELANRFVWPGQEPNYSSADLIFPFAIALGLFSSVKSWKKLFWAMLACMIGISVIGTFSRSGFLSIVVVLCMYMLKGHIKAIIPVILIGGAFLYLVSTIPLLYDRIFGISDEINAGGSGRFYLWNLGVEMWLDSPLWGNGLAAFYDKYDTAVHNTYFHILVENGVIGLVLFVSILVICLKTGYKLKALYPDGYHPDVRFSQVLLFGLIGTVMMTSTVTYQDVKLLWFVWGAYAAMFIVAKRELAINARREKSILPLHRIN